MAIAKLEPTSHSKAHGSPYQGALALTLNLLSYNVSG